MTRRNLYLPVRFIVSFVAVVVSMIGMWLEICSFVVQSYRTENEVDCLMDFDQL